MDALVGVTKIVGAVILTAIIIFVIYKTWQVFKGIARLIVGITGVLFCVGLIIFGIMTFPFGIVLIFLGVLLLHVLTE